MAESQNGKRRWAKHLIGVAITIICLVIIARQVIFADIVDALEHFQWPYLALGILSLAFGYALRIFRWSIMLAATGASTTWQNCAAPFLGSIALNNVMPLRLGDVVRAFVFPTEMGIRKTTAASSLLMERLIDLITLLGCLGIGLATLQETHLSDMLAKTVRTFAISGGLILVFVFLFSGRLAHFIERKVHTPNTLKEKGQPSELLLALSHMLNSFEAMSRPRVLLVVIGVSMLVWAGEAGLFYFLLAGFGFESSPDLAIVIMAMVTLSTLAPSSPGYVGPFHLAAFTAISMLGGTAAEAGSYAVLSHLALWLPTTLAGAIAILMRPALFRAIQQKELLQTFSRID
jgi:uncharacterized protein (TIRG00374 family)